MRRVSQIGIGSLIVIGLLFLAAAAVIKWLAPYENWSGLPSPDLATVVNIWPYVALAGFSIAVVAGLWKIFKTGSAYWTTNAAYLAVGVLFVGGVAIALFGKDNFLTALSQFFGSSRRLAYVFLHSESIPNGSTSDLSTTILTIVAVSFILAAILFGGGEKK